MIPERHEEISSLLFGDEAALYAETVFGDLFPDLVIKRFLEVPRPPLPQGLLYLHLPLFVANIPDALPGLPSRDREYRVALLLPKKAILPVLGEYRSEPLLLALTHFLDDERERGLRMVGGDQLLRTVVPAIEYRGDGALNSSYKHYEGRRRS